jgi:hypothetical protein
MTDQKICASCGCDISYRMGNAKYCLDCAAVASKESKAIANKNAYEKAKNKREAERGEKKKPKSHKPKPTSCIRAITPVASELGTQTTNGRREDRIREITPSPVIADQPYTVRPDKKTWVFPKTEKRYQELTSK